jgi:hypothetical protein
MTNIKGLIIIVSMMEQRIPWKCRVKQDSFIGKDQNPQFSLRLDSSRGVRGATLPLYRLFVTSIRNGMESCCSNRHLPRLFMSDFHPTEFSLGSIFCRARGTPTPP